MLEELAERVKEAAHAKVGKIAAQSSVSETADLASHASHETQATRDARPGESARTQSHQPVRGKASALHKPRVLDLPERALVAIGASTGGTTVLSKLISQFPANMPPVVVVQHMPPVFTRMFAQSIDRESAVDVKEAEDGDVARPGLVLIAPGDFHLTVHKHGLGWRVALGKGGKVSGHRPSVDVLFHSVASAAGPQGIGVICTGMGSDGADGMLAMRHSGARCIAQDEDSSVVYGMPKEAWDNGAAEFQVGADRITETVLALLAAERKVRSH
jgi:two-component system chemotaxis response regulator CheB